jgi:hypothetical protein
VDDELTDRDRAWVDAHHPAPALLHHVDARHGLRTDDFAALARWADGLSDLARRGGAGSAQAGKDEP